MWPRKVCIKAEIRKKGDVAGKFCILTLFFGLFLALSTCHVAVEFSWTSVDTLMINC